jgi:hypothetical protein
VVAWVKEVARPQLLAVSDALRRVAPEFTFQVTLGKTFLDQLRQRDQRDYYLDYGDVRALDAGVNLWLAQLDLLLAIDWANLRPEDFDDAGRPDLDPLLVIEQSYSTLGRLADRTELQAAKTHLQRAFESYDAAARHIVAESETERARGIITLSRAADPEQVKAQELRFREWLRAIVNAFEFDGLFRFDQAPDGTVLPPHEQIAVNFVRLFRGDLDPRLLLFKLIAHPFAAGRRTLGASSFGELTAEMASLNGIVGELGGAEPAPGDLQEWGYALRLDAAPVHTKEIDGDFGDWQPGVNAAQIGGPPSGLAAGSKGGLPRPNLGNVWVARDASNVYVFVDADLAQYLLEPSDGYDVWFAVPGEVESGVHGRDSGHSSSSRTGHLPSFRHVPGAGIEIAFPFAPSSGAWAEIAISAAADNQRYAIDSDRGDIFVKVR